MTERLLSFEELFPQFDDFKESFEEFSEIPIREHQKTFIDHNGHLMSIREIKREFIVLLLSQKMKVSPSQIEKILREI